jgi:hypothetical protein
VDKIPPCRSRVPPLLFTRPKIQDLDDQAVPRWLALAGPVTSISALGVLGFVYGTALLPWFGVDGEARDLLLFIYGGLLLPPICAAIELFLIRPDYSGSRAGAIETVNCWAAVFLLLGLAALPPFLFLRALPAESWLASSTAVIIGVAAAHATALVLTMALRAAGWMPRKRPRLVFSRASQSASLILMLALASFTLFWIDPANRYFSTIIKFFLEPPFKQSGGTGLAGTFVGAALGIGCVAVLIWLEALLRRQFPEAMRIATVIVLAVAVVTTFAFYFDFSLTADTFHYMTNVGPALATLHGATPMVDAFSQYGPGPVLATLVGFRFGPITFGTAQIVAQVFNLAFYGLWLVCLARMTHSKLAALLLGFAAIALYFSLWERGVGNINDAPSLLGLRHLPTLLMVAALSFLSAPRRHSLFTAASTFISALWSVETLIATLAVHFAFLGLIDLRDRAPVRLVRDSVLAVLPVAAALAVMTSATLWRSGTVPDLVMYLRFISSYNMMNDFWAIVASPFFFGWLAMLLALFIVLTDAWARVVRPGSSLVALKDEIVFHRFVPMAMLLMLQAAYFVGRSVDYTLDMALFPFCALTIAGGLGFSRAVATASGPARLLLAIPVSMLLLAFAFISLTLFRPAAPYSLALHKCQYDNRCSLNAMAQDLRDQVHRRSGLEKVGNKRGDYWLDTSGIIREALTMIEKWAPNEPKVTILLGYMIGDGDDMASDVTLMYAGKWHRWPGRSWTFSDRLGLPLAEKIIAAPVRLSQGELVLVRRDPNKLRVVEAGIWRRIQAEYALCPLPTDSRLIAVYRIAAPAGCSSS